MLIHSLQLKKNGNKNTSRLSFQYSLKPRYILMKLMKLREEQLIDSCIEP